MKKSLSIVLGLGLAFGTVCALAQAPAQTDQPKAEKTKKKGGKTKSEKRKAEEPKAQKKK